MAYPSLQCNQAGFSYLVSALTGSGNATLVTNSGAQFPSLQDGQFFYAILTSPCQDKCLQVKVTATNGDVFSITSPTQDCFPSGTLIRFDADSNEALTERLSGLVREVADPLTFTDGKLTLNWDTFKADLKNLLLNAQPPLNFDGESGNLTFDANKFLSDNKTTILGWFSATSPLKYDASTGVFSLDEAQLKTDLGLTTTTS